AQVVDLRGVRIGDVARFEYLRGACDFGERGANQPAGAAFRHRDGSARRAIGFDDLLRLVVELLRQKPFGHRIFSNRMFATACAAMPSRRPVNPSPSVVVALMLTCSRWT